MWGRNSDRTSSKTPTTTSPSPLFGPNLVRINDKMSREHLSNEDFFSQLAALVEKTQKKGHGSVHLTQKRSTFLASLVRKLRANTHSAQ